jgi:uridine kinase
MHSSIVILNLSEERIKMQPFIIGVAGGTGSGKTTLVERICEVVGEKNVLLISHDRYYRSQDHLPLEERLKTNYDHPNSLETDLLVKHVKNLLADKSVRLPRYDFANHTRAKGTDTAEKKAVIIIEGILIFADETLRELCDLRVFVDTDADVRFGRRLLRDVQERGRTFEFGIQQYLSMAKPMHEEFVEPSKKFADIIVPEGGKNERALRLFDSYLRQHLALVGDEISVDNATA